MNRSTSLSQTYFAINWKALHKTLIQTPTGWLWLSSGLLWGWMVFGPLLLSSSHAHHQHGVSLVSTILTQLIGWQMMLIAMMFPLLAIQVSHVNFSLNKTLRIRGILLFLCGYSAVWFAFAIMIGLAQIISGSLIYSNDIYRLLGFGCFLTASVLVWTTGHPITLAKCHMTISITFSGSQALKDSFNYGIKIGRNCVQVCWLPMLGLILLNHDLLLMGLVAIALWYERYCISHISKQMSFIWVIMVCLLLTY